MEASCHRPACTERVGQSRSCPRSEVYGHAYTSGAVPAEALAEAGSLSRLPDPHAPLDVAWHSLGTPCRLLSQYRGQISAPSRSLPGGQGRAGCPWPADPSCCGGRRGGRCRRSSLSTALKNCLKDGSRTTPAVPGTPVAHAIACEGRLTVAIATSSTTLDARCRGPPVMAPGVAGSALTPRFSGTSTRRP